MAIRSPDYLFQGDKLHISVYTDPEIFKEEMTRIFHKVWMFVGHVSEVAKPGDFLTAYIGVQPVVLSRDKDDQLRVFFNLSTANRDAPLLLWEYGHEDFIADFEKAKKEFGLIEVARVNQHRGFVFANMEKKGPSLMEHLGLSAEWIDDFVDRSPTGELELEGGFWRHVYLGNWKFQVEGSNEGYHTDFLHRISRLANERTGTGAQAARRGGGGIGAGSSVGYDLGNGHSLIIFPGVPESVWRERFDADYIKALEDAHGVERAKRILGVAWRLVVYPNFNLADTHIRYTRPITFETAEIRQWNVVLKGIPESMQVRMVKGHEGFYGPAGFGSPDDIEIFARMHQGYKTLSADGLNLPEWALFNRGYTLEQVGPRGEKIGHASSEVMQRSAYYAWRSLMKGESHITALPDGKPLQVPDATG